MTMMMRLMAAGLVVCLVSITEAQVTPGQDAFEAQVEELGTTLKAAVLSGAIDEKDAAEIYTRVVSTMKASIDEGERTDGVGKGRAGQSTKPDLTALRPPKPGDLQALVRPEFYRRDLPLLKDALELDEDQMLILSVVIDDYTTGFELAAAPLIEMLARYHSATMNAYIATALADADASLAEAVLRVQDEDRERAVERVGEQLDAWAEQVGLEDEKRAAMEPFRANMFEATRELDQRLADLRERTRSQLESMQSDDNAIDARDLVTLARQLRTDRRQLREDVESAILVIATDDQRGPDNERMLRALARLRIAHDLPEGHFAGESMDLWIASRDLARTPSINDQDRMVLERIDAFLFSGAPLIARHLDDRINASIDREIAGLEFQAMRDAIAAEAGTSPFALDAAVMRDAIEPFRRTASREIDARVVVRDALLMLLNSATIEAMDMPNPMVISRQYRDEAMRRGFPIDMQQRWSERAYEAALALEDLDDEVRTILVEREGMMQALLHDARVQAVQKRLERDPKVARDRMESLDGELKRIEEEWRADNATTFVRLDDQAESDLTAHLTPAQFELIQPRPQPWWREKSWDKDERKRKSK
ncbi:MAG: hypothetical protein AAF432_06280 [Planctomycetota bacterium]